MALARIDKVIPDWSGKVSSLSTADPVIVKESCQTMLVLLRCTRIIPNIEIHILDKGAAALLAGGAAAKPA
jgi:hypothetical protein